MPRTKSHSMVPNKHNSSLPYRNGERTLALVTEKVAKKCKLARVGDASDINRERTHIFVYVTRSQRACLRKMNLKGMRSDVYTVNAKGAQIRVRAY